MNASEKKILYLAFTLFVIGFILRFLPWGLPSIESFEVGEDVVVPLNSPSSSSKLEYLSSASFTEAFSSESAQVNTVEKREKRQKKKAVVFPLPINSAEFDDLCAIKGVGPKLAEKILERRNALGPFKNASDLQKVPGIGKKKLESILQQIIFD